MLAAIPAFVKDGYIWAGFGAAVLGIWAFIKHSSLAGFFRAGRRAFVGWLMADTMIATKDEIDAADDELRGGITSLSQVIDVVKDEVAMLKDGQATIHETQHRMTTTLDQIKDALIGREPTAFDPHPAMGLIAKVDRLMPNGGNTDNPGDLLLKLAQDRGVTEVQKSEDSK